MIRVLMFATFFIACSAMVAACGQKGPLKLPEPAPAKSVTAAP